MAIKFQYNKTALQSLNKQLKMRLNALPVIKNKETALRMEVKKAKTKVKELDKKLSQKIQAYTLTPGIWNEFNTNLITIDDVKTTTKKIAGVKTPVLEEVLLQTEDFSLFDNPKWFPEGISIVKELAEVVIEREFFNRKMELLNHARRKTTQKVNLYEKVQIPGYEDAIRKIKRFLEDEENLSKSSQKIVKDRQQRQMEANK
ncbi:MAG: V-type ATP synthase subunit D [Bacteroidales bacterium]|nr:V-type ATP synthase subunit D [Bacteroidales bacterium]MCD4773063.1 V-type ATP synthase subunit D [Bacteroidales bacterium]